MLKQYSLKILITAGDGEIVTFLKLYLDDEQSFEMLVKKVMNTFNMPFSTPIIDYHCDISKLVNKCWSNYFNFKSEDVLNYDEIELCFLSSTLKELDELFNLNNEEIEILFICGLGGVIGEIDGIKFILRTKGENDRHHQPHIHVEYDNENKPYDIVNCKFIKCTPFRKSRVNKTIEKFVSNNQEGLLKYWNNPLKVKEYSFIFKI